MEYTSRLFYQKHASTACLFDDPHFTVDVIRAVELLLDRLQNIFLVAGCFGNRVLKTKRHALTVTGTCPGMKCWYARSSPVIICFPPAVLVKGKVLLSKHLVQPCSCVPCIFYILLVVIVREIEVDALGI